MIGGDRDLQSDLELQYIRGALQTKIEDGLCCIWA